MCGAVHGSCEEQASTDDLNLQGATFAACHPGHNTVLAKNGQCERQHELPATMPVWIVCVVAAHVAAKDLVPVSERSNTVELLAPADGTNLWADVWVVPAHAQHGHLQSGPSPILPSWLEFSISPARGEVLNGLK